MPRSLALAICLLAAAIGVGPWVRGAISESPAEAAKTESGDRKAEEVEPEPEAQPTKQSYLSRWLKRAAEFAEEFEPLPLPPLAQEPQPIEPKPIEPKPIEPKIDMQPKKAAADPESPSDVAGPALMAPAPDEPALEANDVGDTGSHTDSGQGPTDPPVGGLSEGDFGGEPETGIGLGEPSHNALRRSNTTPIESPADEYPVTPYPATESATENKPEDPPSVVVKSTPSLFGAPAALPAEAPDTTPPAPATPVKFPPLPPDPYAEEQPVLWPIEAELHHRGGAHLYSPEGDGFQEHLHESLCHGDHEAIPKRLPEHFQAPQPCTRLPGVPTTEYLGADPIQLSPHAWPGPGGYQWEPRFVAHGRYDVFGLAFEENDVRQDGIGHNLTLDADLRLTGTERFHLQHRPIGEDGSGGSFYQFSETDQYFDNSTAEPARVWFEGEVASIFSGLTGDSTRALDMNFAVGKFPLGLHNNLLMNDEVAGVIVGNNNLQLGTLSNLNVRGFWLWDDINSFDATGSQTRGSNVLGADAFIDFRHAFVEATYAYLQHAGGGNDEAHYFAVSGTQFFGPSALTGRAMARAAGSAAEDGQLYVIEYNTHCKFAHGLLPRSGVHHAVAYANVFYATDGWSPIAGANFNRIRSSFEVNPLVLIARGDRDDTPGVAVGVQLFGEGDDSSLTPELAWEAPDGTSVFGAGMRYQRQTSVQSFLELRGLINVSDHSPFDRDGVFASHHWLF